MKFQTETELPKYNFRLSYQDAICLMGSCFSDHIGQALVERKFITLSNPLGISFNPRSIARQLEYVLDQERLSPKQLVFGNGLWHHFDFHGSFSGPDKTQVIATLREKLLLSFAFLKSAKVLFITFGTANVYLRKESQEVVANNHKFPIEDFIKIRLAKEDIVKNYRNILKRLKELNPELQIVFTVSPVRYLREGLIENQRSKATLLLVVDELENLPDVNYFPSYEMFVDTLRDYRFYAKDMLHPGVQGIEFVWEKFVAQFFDEYTCSKLAEVERLINATNHRPIHPESADHKAFTEKLIHQIRTFSNENPALDFSDELSRLDAV